MTTVTLTEARLMNKEDSDIDNEEERPHCLCKPCITNDTNRQHWWMGHSDPAFFCAEFTVQEEMLQVLLDNAVAQISVERCTLHAEKATCTGTRPNPEQFFLAPKGYYARLCTEDGPNVVSQPKRHAIHEPHVGVTDVLNMY